MDLSDRQGFCPPDCPGFRPLNVRRCSGTGRLMIPMTSLRRYVCHPVTLSQDAPYRGQSQYQARLIPLMRSKRCAVCTCSMYLQYVLAGCTCSMYLQYVLAVCTCSMYLQYVLAVCTCSMYLQYVLAVCTCSMYLQDVLAVCACSMYLQYVLAVCTCSMY